MGFVLNSVHNLVFEEFTDDNGECLEVKAKPMTLAEWVDLTTGKRTAIQNVELFESHLISWNLLNRGEDGELTPVPATPEGVRSQDIAFILRLLNTWASELGSVFGPLGGRSTSGPPSLEESLPMEPLSPSPPNSPAPN